jgi:hypothetical protein
MGLLVGLVVLRQNDGIDDGTGTMHTHFNLVLPLSDTFWMPNLLTIEWE